MALRIENIQRFSAGIAQKKLPPGWINFDQRRQGNLETVLGGYDLESFQTQMNRGTRWLLERRGGSRVEVILANRLPVTFRENGQLGEHPGGLHVFPARPEI